MTSRLREIKKSELESIQIPSTSVKLIDMIVYKPYYNGSMCITNVPYTVKVDVSGAKRERVRFESVSTEVYRQLGVIFEYMEQHFVQEVDYQFFMSIYKGKQEGKDNPEEKEAASASESGVIQQISIDDREAVVEYVMEEWIKKYYKLRLLAKGNVPVASDAMKEKEAAQAKLEFFHVKLEKLSELHQSIIKKKYLEIERNQEFLLDDLVYEELHISRSYYYKSKKEALYTLGLALING